jgi:hypothetical protein
VIIRPVYAAQKYGRLPVRDAFGARPEGMTADNKTN